MAELGDAAALAVRLASAATDDDEGVTEGLTLVIADDECTGACAAHQTTKVDIRSADAIPASGARRFEADIPSLQYIACTS